jgi:hypothetical protein
LDTCTCRRGRGEIIHTSLKKYTHKTINFTLFLSPHIFSTSPSKAMMFISSKTFLFALVLAAASCNAVTGAAKDHQPVLRGNMPPATVESPADAHGRMLDPLSAFEGNQTDLAVMSGASIIFTHNATEITLGDVCADSSFTGEPSTETDSLDYELVNGTAYSGGCSPKYLVDLLAGAMAKAAKPIAPEMGGKTFSAGTYFSASLTVADNTVVTLHGDTNDIFLFQSGSYMVTGANTEIKLTGNVTAENVLFATTSAFTTGAAGSKLQGSILSGAAVTLGEGSEVQGYVLATAALTVRSGCTLNSASIGADTDPVAPAILNAVCPVAAPFACTTGCSAVCNTAAGCQSIAAGGSASAC